MPSSSCVDPALLSSAGEAAGCKALASTATASAMVGVVQRVLLQPPRPKKIAKVVKFGVEGEGGAGADRSKHPEKLMAPPAERVDPFYWLRDDAREDPEVLSTVRRENAHTQEVCRPLAATRKQVYAEILSHVNETDSSFPYAVDDYLYYTRTVKGLSYSIYCRKKRIPKPAAASADGGGAKAGSADDDFDEGPEEVLLDVNKLAEGRDFCDVSAVRPSQDHSRFLFLVDYCGDETYELQVREAAPASGGRAGRLVDRVEDVAQALWGRDQREVFYVTHDKAHRPYKLWHHIVATTPPTDDDGDVEETEAAKAGSGGSGNGVASDDGDGDDDEEGSEESAEIERTDALLFTELDERFNLSASKSLDHRWVFFSSGSAETSEVHVCDARRANVPQLLALGEGQGGAAAAGGQPLPAPVFKCLRPREQKVEYDVTSFDGHFYFLSNVGGLKNFALYRAPYDAALALLPASPAESGATLALGTTPDAAPASLGFAWVPALPYDPDVYLTDIEGFRDYLAVFGRRGGFTKAWIMRAGTAAGPSLTAIEFDEPIYDVYDGPNCNFASPVLRLHYSSMTTPRTVVDVDTRTLAREVKHVKAVPNYDAAEYAYATARDGKTRVPMCAVFSKKLRGAAGKDAALPFTKGPVLLYGYGSYGCCMDPYFSAMRLPLLDRGVVYVVANIRGGSEMGRSWYEDEGKMATKINTFTDFIDCAQHLVDTGLTSPEQLAINGASAGGLLMGATINMAPEGLFRCVLAEVPFVDVLQTMSDPSIPLTVGEWEEFGNPNEQELYDYMSKYCPVTNVRHGQRFPSVLITGGLHDPRVAYWEPLKWAAQIRDKMDRAASGPVLVKIDMAGHFSASDRYKYIKDEAFGVAFVLERLGLLGEECALASP